SQQHTLPGAATPVTTSSTYDKADRILTAGSLSYAFDADGNVRSRTPSGGSATTYAYGQANRRTGATAGGAISSYGFDRDGKRVSRTSGGTTNSYVYDTTGGLPMLLDDGQRKYVYGPSGVLYEVDKASGSPYVLHTDAQGSVRVITDSLGNVVESYYNDEYGNPLITLSASAPNNVASQPLQYTAEPRDSETGLIYLRARMYDPSLGRFLQRDPKGLTSCDKTRPGSLNMFTYAEDNPLTIGDPTGMQATGTFWPPRGDCDQLRQLILATYQDLHDRYYDLIEDPRGLRIANWDLGHADPQHPEWGTVEGHRLQFEGQQNRLRSLLPQWYTDSCDLKGGPPLPSDVWTWAWEVEAPTPLNQGRPRQPHDPAPQNESTDAGYDWSNFVGDLNRAIERNRFPAPFPVPIPVPRPAFP
ncbi:MAG: hypothetical protein QOF51_1741, partial [Chloroflexota bacterium]|nr:hypothetical protein [Chloroflexota bacterium]